MKLNKKYIFFILLLLAILAGGIIISNLNITADIFSADTLKIARKKTSQVKENIVGSETGGLVAKPILKPGETGSWFKIKADPGSVWNGEIMVINQNSIESFTALIYAVDVEATSGGFAPKSSDANKIEAKWVTVDTPELELSPASSKIVPIKIDFPENATPGEHAIAIMVEPKPVATDASGGAPVVTIQTRVGIRTYITLSGEVVIAAEMAEPVLSGEHPYIIRTRITNKGNSIIKPTVTAKFFDQSDAKIDTAQSANIYEIFPGGGADVDVSWDYDKPGTYKAKLLISFADKNEERELTINVTEKPKEEDKTHAVAAAPIIVQNQSSVPVVALIVGAFVIIILVGLIIFLLLRQRKKDITPDQLQQLLKQYAAQQPAPPAPPAPQQKP